ncbi:hypothetical protein SS1G_06488 [Sclerotinia sclerotiorum 1980 UF-70]|uniref:Small ribosomal subunit protein uS11m n=2 Tax=Sclerotinia sclerotiorum (strain ATCC 18683 / 1980 / Ss-1) TaxID=665079 RepID=A7EME0_SCLS1|nr:hypothetical protein SS1G_06488 [Sclerotinia sclerotiorum 1980 UF-70]APA14542.1 hypothetical protein sscle_13g093120 [Sclerotinia sclerotiorum 1980 UF-70]EDO04006.1 hypothetical protein SS1G_06488 [Sclerotinia sclerotiorum 1980 UF-70]
MSRTLSRRVLTQSPLSSIAEFANIHTLPLRCSRPFSSTSNQRAEGDDPLSNYVPHNSSTLRYGGASGAIARASAARSASLNPKATRSSAAGGGGIANIFQGMMEVSKEKKGAFQNTSVPKDGTLIGDRIVEDEPHHFHVYATRHNTHITLTRPNREPIISVSCGNIGFRHSGRKHYDSAFQLAAFVMSRIHERAIGRDIQKLELVLRGFGAGREAVTKALLGTEGRWLRGKVVKVTDATRLKFGGTRSKKPRRLG